MAAYSKVSKPDRTLRQLGAILLTLVLVPLIATSVANANGGREAREKLVKEGYVFHLVQSPSQGSENTLASWAADVSRMSGPTTAEELKSRILEATSAPHIFVEFNDRVVAYIRPGLKDFGSYGVEPFITDLFTDEAHRGMGIAKAMLG